MKKIPGAPYLKDKLDLDVWRAKIRSYSFLVGEGALDLAVSLIVMVMVERSLGAKGLGIFAYLLSILMFAGLISEFGVSRFLEREIAITKGSKPKKQLIEKALCAVFVTSTICAVFFVVTAVFDTSHTRVEEKVIAYVIIGITIPLRNLNRIRIAILQGEGQFGITAALKTWKRVVLFGAVFLLLFCKISTSYLIVGYFISDFALMIKARKSIKLPSFVRIWNKKNDVASILSNSGRFFLTDEAMEFVLYMDFFILGIFVSSADLGVYAQASILARIFLLIPTSIKPVFRKQYCALASNNRLGEVSVLTQMATALLFYGHAVLMVFFLLYFPGILQWFFPDSGQNMVPFYLFAEILPGLLFFSAVTSQEPLYEAEKKVRFLQKLIFLVALLNLGLNCFFIPFAGFFGAAFATSCSMFVYFILFGNHLDPIFRIDKFNFISAGASVYLIYMLFDRLDLSFVLTSFLVPGLLFLCLFLINFFDFKIYSGR